MGSLRVVVACVAATALLSVACQRKTAPAPVSQPGDTRTTPGAAPATPPAPQASGGPVTPRTEAPNEARVLSSAFSAVAKALRPSVVRIDVEIQQPLASRGGRARGGGGRDQVPPFFRRFFDFEGGGDDATDLPQRGTGSGVVLDASGNIVTNRHVVSGATTTKVAFSDGREFSARTIGMDSETDVAVIRLDKPPADLIAARLGDSDKLEVGEWVLAVGSPLGLDQTVTAGIVSGKGRVGRHVQMSGGRVRQYIQTDAKINPGNSGGPLVNLSSEVVGINTLINTGPGGAYGFAIPINQVRRVAQSLLAEGRIRYPYLGVLVGDLSEVDADRRAKLGAGLPDNAAVVSEVTPGGPAAKGGLKAGDVITDLDAHKIESAGDVIDYVSAQRIGATVTVGYLRGGQRATSAVVLGELPSSDSKGGVPAAARLGLLLQTLTPELAQSMGLDPGTRGAAIAEVAPGGAAARAGLEAGEIILEIDRHGVAGADEATSALLAPRKGGHLLRVRGGAGTRFVTLSPD
ncbi:MAG TPA: trypsin-like peptidase domain-containing protein [Polyangia bacterium]|nr:trypsin-like peptidase domain-containing protein [Polyangia bacterium]